MCLGSNFFYITTQFLDFVIHVYNSFVGSGIFVSPKGVLEDTGSVGLSLVIWTACGLLSMLGEMRCYSINLDVPFSGFFIKILITNANYF